MKPIMIYIDEKEKQGLNKLAERVGLSFSSYARMILLEKLNKTEKEGEDGRS